jgi:hypothetical protein
MNKETGTKMAKHNKKRNVGLIHEQLVRYASEKIVEGKKSIAENAVNVLNSHFEEGTELYREFRLFNSLVHTKTKDHIVARRIIEESRRACKVHDSNKLRSEKSNLIKSINHRIDEQTFYNQRVPNYKILATVQALLNEWRGADKLSPGDIVKYESTLESWITQEERKVDMTKKVEADPLALKIMTEKFNKKYSLFGKDQMRLLEFKLLGDDKNTELQVEKIKLKAQNALENFYRDCKNKTLNNKRQLVEANIKNLKVGSDDDSIKKSLMIAQLIHELEDNNE